jgi:uroporphyrinogen III methyltransferase/synthase
VSGRVHLVGAGPGDPGLMTARAIELLGATDVVLHDRLIPPTALEHVRPGTLVIDVGKVGGGEQVPQEETHRLLLEHALAGRDVVRLKGGDPFVFGRGGEEGQLCREHGIPFDVVPGVTAGVAAPAYAGIPVTQRGVSSAVAFVTGHEDPDKPETAIDWAALARFPGTLVFYMGVRALPHIAERLIAEGRAADEPAAVIERGTLPEQRAVRGPLAEIAARVAEEGVRPPSVTVVGPVAALADELAWLHSGPLEGAQIVVTRAREQASGLAQRLRDLGAHVVEAPAIRIEPVDTPLPDLAGVDLVVVSSPNGVRRLFEALRAGGRDARALAGARIAVVGPGTAEAMRANGIEPDVVPVRAVGEALAEALERLDVRRAIVIRGERARTVVADALTARGADVESVTLYRTVAEPLDSFTRDRALGADWVTVTSGSSAQSFVEAAGGAGAVRDSDLRIASIGPLTSAALRALGLEPDLEAAEHTPAGLIEALLVALAGPGR